MMFARLKPFMALTFFAASLSLFPIKGFSQSTEPSSVTETYGSWTLRCQKPQDQSQQKICEVLINIRNNQGGVITQLALGKEGENKKRVLVVQVPLGTLLTGPIILQDQDGQETIEVPYFSCFNGSCFARYEATAQDLQKVVKSGTGAIKFRERNGRTIQVNISFDGFDTALDRLDQL